jgi:hypothetical protein
MDRDNSLSDSVNISLDYRQSVECVRSGFLSWGETPVTPPCSLHSGVKLYGRRQGGLA